MTPAAPVTQPPPASGEVLAGTVERIVFRNADNGFTVLKLAARGYAEPVTVVGTLAAIGEGEFVHASGRWVVDPTHGRQFRAEHIRTSHPASAEGIERFLRSGAIKGIGAKYANKLVRAFGANVFDVIENQPERLRDVAGIGLKRADRIRSAWAAQKVVREIMVFLFEHGIGTAQAVRIHRTYGSAAVAVISDNPYRLAMDVRGIGFARADAIAARLGITRDAMSRRRAGLRHVLDEARSAGHCGLPTSAAVAAASSLLQLPASAIEEALAVELRARTLVADTIGGEACVFPADLYGAERTIARRLRALAEGRPPWPAIDAGRAIPWVEARLGVSLSDDQRRAVATALASKVIVISGGPGVGKTTLMRSLLSIVSAKGVRPALAAPTGRAAKRLSEATGLTAKTIHRLLEFDPLRGAFRRDAGNRLVCDLVVVDETSMADVPLMRSLIEAIPDHAALVLVGDADQLPSVGPGQVLDDILGSAAVPVVLLTQVHRQASASRIVLNAHRIREGRLPELSDEPTSDFRFIPCTDAEDAAAIVRRLAAELLPAGGGFDARRDIQVLSPMNRGPLGARALNIALQQALHPHHRQAVECFGWRFAVGDKVMQLDNDYERDVFNGDLGFITAIDTDDQEVVVTFDGRPVTYDFDDLERLTLAYATTIHKAQGSEYPAVIIPMTMQHFPMLQKQLLYTAVTRGRRLVVIVGDRRAIAVAVKSGRGGHRHSKLREFLGG